VRTAGRYLPRQRPRCMNRSSESGVLSRWRACWLAARSIKWNQRWAIDARLVLLTLVNALLYWPWHWLRTAFNAGDHHPNLVLGLLLLTLYLWFELAKAVSDRFKR
jgi:hypothetical protein